MNEPISVARKIAGYCGIAVIIFALYRSLPFTTLVPTLIARKITFLLLMSMVYLTTEPWKNVKGNTAKFVNCSLYLIGVVALAYLIWLWQYLPFRMMVPPPAVSEVPIVTSSKMAH